MENDLGSPLLNRSCRQRLPCM